MKKRILSLLLAAAMLLAAAPLAAFADSPASEATIGIIGGADGPTAIYVSGADEIVSDVPEAVQGDIMLIGEETALTGEAAGEAPAPAESPAEAPEAAPEEDGQLTYLAFKGYPNTSYVSYVAEMLGLDRDHALDLGLPALMTKDLLEMVRDGQMSEFNQPAGTYYVYPEFLDYIKQADVISIQIGMNDAMVPFVVSIGNATNWKSEQLANTIVSGGYRDMTWDNFVKMAQQLFGLRLTMKETGDLFYALTTGAAQVCNTAYNNVAAYLPQIVEAIRAQNPDAQILLLGCYNPVPLLWTWSNFFNRYNRFVRDLAEQTGCTYVAIPRTKTANDGHPTTAGHKYIAQQIVEAIEQ